MAEVAVTVQTVSLDSTAAAVVSSRPGGGDGLLPRMCQFAILFLVGLALLSLILSFGLVDLYFAYNDESCVHVFNPASVGFTLATWLKVDGYMIVSYATISVFTRMAGLTIKRLQSTCTIFSLVWIVVGSVMFWNALAPSGLCSDSLFNYMWARLVVGYISGLAVLCFPSNSRSIYSPRW
jgi:hypothetical protein